MKVDVGSLEMVEKLIMNMVIGQNIAKRSQKPFRCPSTLGMVLHATHPHPKLFGKRNKQR
jgi:hypothetical protein